MIEKINDKINLLIRDYDSLQQKYPDFIKELRSKPDMLAFGLGSSGIEPEEEYDEEVMEALRKISIYDDYRVLVDSFCKTYAEISKAKNKLIKEGKKISSTPFGNKINIPKKKLSLYPSQEEAAVAFLEYYMKNSAIELSQMYPVTSEDFDLNELSIDMFARKILTIDGVKVHIFNEDGDLCRHFFDALLSSPNPVSLRLNDIQKIRCSLCRMNVIPRELRMLIFSTSKTSFTIRARISNEELKNVGLSHEKLYFEMKKRSKKLYP